MEHLCSKLIRLLSGVAFEASRALIASELASTAERAWTFLCQTVLCLRFARLCDGLRPSIVNDGGEKVSGQVFDGCSWESCFVKMADF